MSNHYQSYYAAHVAEMQSRWTAALEAEGLQAVLVHSGTPMYSFQDDYEYAFRPNPNFLAWLPLTRQADSTLLIVPGEKPALVYYQPEDYWHLPPADPEPWWADHFDIEVVRAASGKPSLTLHGSAAALAEQMGVRSWHLSLSHTAQVAHAIAVAS